MRPRTKLGWCNATLMSLATVISCGLSGNGLSQAAVLGGSMVGTPGSSTNVVGEANTVTVTGFGSLTLNATVAQINLQISVSDNTVHNVLNDNRKFEQQAQSELKRLKIPTGDIRISTNGLSIGNGPAWKPACRTSPATWAGRKVHTTLQTCPSAELRQAPDIRAMTR